MYVQFRGEKRTGLELLAAAQRLVEHPDAGTGGVWPRAALLARQALEQATAGLRAGQPGADGFAGRPMQYSYVPHRVCG